MTDIIVTLTVPYAGVDRKISGSPLNIAKVALLIEQGLPTLADMNLDGIAHLCNDVDGTAEMGMGNGPGREFVTGSHTLLMALQRVLLNTAPEANFRVSDIRSRRVSPTSKMTEMTIVDGNGRRRQVYAMGGRADNAISLNIVR